MHPTTVVGGTTYVPSASNACDLSHRLSAQARALQCIRPTVQGCGYVPLSLTTSACRQFLENWHLDPLLYIYRTSSCAHKAISGHSAGLIG
jgi:hypothetical protein